jgi:hypothetical protein
MAPEVFRHEKYSEKVDIYGERCGERGGATPTGAPSSLARACPQTNPSPPPRPSPSHPLPPTPSAAFAMLLYYLTHGEPPFAWMPPVEAAQSAALQHLRPEMRPTLNRDLAALIDKCWLPDAAARPSAREVCAILEKLFPDTEDSPDLLDEGCKCAIA